MKHIKLTGKGENMAQPISHESVPSMDAGWNYVTLIAGWVSYAAMVVCSITFEMARLGGVTASEVSNQVFAWFTPAGYAFSIWGVIYIALALWLVAVTQSVVKQQRDETTSLALFTASSMLNIAWLTVFHLQLIEASLAIILVLLGVLAVFYQQEHRRSLTLMRSAPVSIYLGWITVATIANATNLVTRYVAGTPILNEVSTVAIVVAVMLIGYSVARLADDLVYPLALIWATVAVGVHLMDVSLMTAVAVFAVTGVGTAIIYLRASALPGQSARKRTA